VYHFTHLCKIQVHNQTKQAYKYSKCLLFRLKWKTLYSFTILTENMKLSKTELKAFELICKGIQRPKQLSASLEIASKQTSEIIKDLFTKGFVEKESHYFVTLTRNVHVQALKDIILKKIELTDILCDSRILILAAIADKNLTIKEISAITQLKKTQAYKYIKCLKRRGVLNKKDNTYEFNKILWGNLYKFIKEYDSYFHSVDPRLPKNAQVLYRDNKKTIFASKESYDASLTAFSRFQEFGIKLMLAFRYYRMPKTELGIKDVFIDALNIAKTLREKMSCILFYLKNKILLKGIKHPLLEEIKLVLEKEEIKGYPSIKEIKEKADEYDIRF